MQLEPKNILLEEVSLRYAKKDYKRYEAGSSSKKEDVSVDFHNGYKVAIYLAPQKRLLYGYVAKVKVLVSERNGAVCAFRLRFYKGQGSKDKPPSSTELPTTAPIIGTAPIGGGWVEFNLKDEYLPIDSLGVYAAVEWLPQENPVAYKIEYRDTNQCHRIREAKNFSLAIDNSLRYEEHISWFINPIWFGHFEWDRLRKRRNTRVSAPIIVADIVVTEREEFKWF